MQDIKDNLLKLVKMSFFAADKGAKYALFRFIETMLSDMGHHSLLGKCIHKSFERWTQSKVHMNKLNEEAIK